MLKVACEENSDSHIEYINMPMEDIIAFVKDKKKYDFAGVVRNIYELLYEGGEFIFSQEHPLNTSHQGGDRWTRDENGQKLYLNLVRMRTRINMVCKQC